MTIIVHSFSFVFLRDGTLSRNTSRKRCWKQKEPIQDPISFVKCQNDAAELVTEEEVIAIAKKYKTTKYRVGV